MSNMDRAAHKPSFRAMPRWGQTLFCLAGILLLLLAAVVLTRMFYANAAAALGDFSGGSSASSSSVADVPKANPVASSLLKGEVIHSSQAASLTTYLPVVFMPLPSLKDQLTVVPLALPQPLARATGSWCTWGYCSLSPRLYHEPLVDDRTLLGWTDASGNGHVSTISGSAIERTLNFPGRVMCGLVAHSNGSFTALLWDNASEIMWLSKRDENGGEIWTTNLNSSIAVADLRLGDTRLTYGNGRYAAYFTVYGISGGYTGHNGDQLTYVDDSGNVQTGGWVWGCSHSMAELVSYHSNLDQFVAICSSDCYSSKGILTNNSRVVYASDGDCGGLVSAQLGQSTLGDSTWKIVFSALDRPCCEGRGIGLATVDESLGSSYVWLTNTNGGYERDPVIARLGVGVQPERYLVGWMTTNDDAYWLGIVDGAGNFQSGPEEVSSAGIRWGNRDDSFRTRVDGSVSWVQGDPYSTQLVLIRFAAP